MTITLVVGTCIELQQSSSGIWFATVENSGNGLFTGVLNPHLDPNSIIFGDNISVIVAN